MTVESFFKFKFVVFDIYEQRNAGNVKYARVI